MRFSVLLSMAGVSLALWACAQTPDVSTEGGSAARMALAEHATEGPVLAFVEGAAQGLGPAARDELVTGAMARGVIGLDVDFTTDRAPAAVHDPYLVVALNPASTVSASSACRQPQAIRTASGEAELRVLAAFCRDGEPLGVARGEMDAPITDRRQLERLLWSTTGQLFPDDYAESYGFDVLPRWLNLGIGGDFGF